MTQVVVITMNYPWTGTPVPDKAELDRLMNRTKGRLFYKPGIGFLGSLLCDMRILWDDSIPTACTNGEYIKWNPEFFMWIDPEERVTVLAHELWHPGYMHCDPNRIMGRCPDKWNEAADHVINLRLQQDGFVFGPKLLSMKPFMDPQYKNMSTEQIYEKIAPPPMGLPMPCSSGQPQDPNGQGQNGGHPMKDIVGADQGDRDKLIAKVIKASQSSRMAKEAGVIPGETELIIDKFLNPILPWKQLLMRFHTDLIKDDYTWKRPNRRYQDDYLPSINEDEGRLEHLIYYQDISGSVSDADILRFNSELKYIQETLRPRKLSIVTFDTKLHDFYEFKEDEPFEEIKVHGRGGTSLHEVEEHIRKMRPTAAVIFSDLYCSPMQQDPLVPILWVVVGNPGAKVPFGQMIHIDNEG